MLHRDAIIIGGGLFGQVAAAELRRLGLEVAVIDSKEPRAGSRPAACLMKPSWFASMGRDKYEPALKTLDQLYGIEDVMFKVTGAPLKATVHWVRPHKILVDTDVIQGKVVDLKRNPEGGFTATLDKWPEGITAPVCVVAAGVWTNELLGMLGGVNNVPKLSGRAGAAFIWKGHIESFISPWAPYRQIVGFNRAQDEVWVGDGTAIKPENLNEEALRTSLGRCSRYSALEPTAHVAAQIGIRPYTPEAKPAWLDSPEKGLWVVTGGAKNGTIAAGWCAHAIGRAVQ